VIKFFLAFVVASVGCVSFFSVDLKADCSLGTQYFVFDELEKECTLLDSTVATEVICNASIFSNCTPRCCAVGGPGENGEPTVQSP